MPIQEWISLLSNRLSQLTMKKSRLISFVIFLLLTSFVYSQSKYVSKSKKMYEKEKFEKCIQLSKKSLKKEKKSSNLQYYIVASNLSLSQISKSKTKQYSYLKKTISAWKRLEKYNTSNKDYSNLKDSIILLIYQFSETNFILRNRQKTEFLHNKLAVVFSDTSEVYRSIQYKETPVVEIKIDKSIDDTRQRILENAIHVLGVRYKYGGTDSTGFDCSGFTQYVYKNVGIDLPHNASKQSQIGTTIQLKDAKREILFFLVQVRLIMQV